MNMFLQFYHQSSFSWVSLIVFHQNSEEKVSDNSAPHKRKDVVLVRETK